MALEVQFATLPLQVFKLFVDSLQSIYGRFFKTAIAVVPRSANDTSLFYLVPLSLFLVLRI